MSKIILGISAYYHDSAAALTVDGKIVAAAQEERFTRKKQDAAFPENAVRFVLQQYGISLGQVDQVAFYEKPLLTFERLLETYHAFAPKGFRSFAAAMPVWLKEKLFLRHTLTKELAKLAGDEAVPPLLFPEHHLSHAASAFFPSPFEKAAVLTADGVGEWATTTICRGDGNSLELLRSIEFPHSLGLLYSAVTGYCGFKVNSGEYKLMGLAPYGNPEAEETARFERVIRDELVDIRDDGSYMLNMDYFEFATGLRMYDEAKWQAAFGIPPRAQESELGQSYMNMALAIQNVTEDIMLRLARTAREVSGCENLCLAGGVALNCVANGKILKEKVFKEIWIQPASGDAGGALGAALAAWHIHAGQPRTTMRPDAMQGCYLGPSFTETDVQKLSNRYGAVYKRFDQRDDLYEESAALLAEGRIVGWFQGRMEYGPRALGGRSILGDPRVPDMQKRLNLKIKFREGFRPFAPSVLEEHISEWFDLDSPSPYMLLVAPVAGEHLRPLPDNYADLPLHERLYFLRSSIPAVTHIDYSARVQSVSETNPAYQALIRAFARKSGVPLLVNTSFNVRGEPIVCTPDDAYTCFMRTDMDALVIENCLFLKEEQPFREDDQAWKKEYVLD